MLKRSLIIVYGFLIVFMSTISLADSAAADSSAKPVPTNERLLSGLQKYEELFSEYEQALNAYQRHKHQIQQRINDLHRQSQASAALNAPISLPNFKPLSGLEANNHGGLQAQEQRLQQGEVQLQSLLTWLMTDKDKLAPIDYVEKWSDILKLASAHKNQSMQFSLAVDNIKRLTTDQLHDMMHAAIVSGDYTQSMETYAEVQRRTALENAELYRADVHEHIADLFLSKLQLLNPSLAQGSTTSLSIEQENAELAQEFTHLQALYKQLRQSNPAAGSK